MKILFWTELFPPLIGGAAILNARLARALAERGHDVTVLASLQGQELPEVDSFHGIPVYRLPFWTTLNARDPEAFFRLRGRVKRLKDQIAPDVLHLSFTGASGLLHLQTSNPPIPTVAAVHVDPSVGGGSGVLAGRVLESADWVTSTSEWILGSIHRVAPAVEARSSCVYNGIDAPKVAPEPLSTEPPRLLVLGRLAPEKGVDVAIRATERLVTRFPGLQLTLVGDGPERESLERLVNERDLAASVTVKGWVKPEEVWAEMSSHTMLLVPSTWEEAFGMVAVEAALMERPVVASALGGLPEVVQDGVTGRLVPPEDPAALADVVALLLDDPAALRAMGQAGRQRVLDVFGWDRYVDAYEALYQDVLRGPASADRDRRAS